MLYTHDPQMFYGLKKWKLQYASATRTVQNWARIEGLTPIKVHRDNNEGKLDIWHHLG